METFCLYKGTKFRYYDSDYIVYDMNYSGDKNIIIEHVETRAKRIISLNEFNKAFYNRDISFIKTSNPVENEPDAIRNNVDLADIPDSLVEKAIFRLQAIQPLVESSNLKAVDFQRRVNELNAQNRTTMYSISVRSLYRWKKMYESNDRDIRSLIPNTKNCGARGKHRGGLVAEDIIDMIIREKLASTEKLSARRIYQLVSHYINVFNNSNSNGLGRIKCPSESTVTRRYRCGYQEEKIKSRKGLRKAETYMKQTRKMSYPELPFERVEIDSTIIDVVVVDELDKSPIGRPTLTIALDTATRCIVGYSISFNPPSYQNVMDCLNSCINPLGKTKEELGTDNDWLASGIPINIVIDQGMEYYNKHFTDACQQLGIIISIAPVKTPEFKAGVERVFRTINMGLFHTIPGTTFSNFVEKGEYPSVKKAAITLEQLERALVKYIVDVYHQSYHKGLKGIPARAWEKAMENNFIPRYPKNIETLWTLLGRVEFRRIRRDGIELNGIKYNSQELLALRLDEGNRRLKIKFHPGDLSRIAVFNHLGNAYILVDAIDIEYTRNLSLWKHQVIQRYKNNFADKEDTVSLAKSRAELDEFILDSKRKNKRISSRKKIARYESSGAYQAPITEIFQNTQAGHNTPPYSQQAEYPINIDNLKFRENPPDGWGIVSDLDNPEEER